MGHERHVGGESGTGSTDRENDGGCVSTYFSCHFSLIFLVPFLQNLNPNIEAPVTLILSHLSTLLQAPFTTYTKATPTVGSEGKTLVVNGTLSGLPFTWQFQCQPSASHMVS